MVAGAAGCDKESAMHIVYAAEKPSIAGILSEYFGAPVQEADIEVRANPDKTGSFLIRWNLDSFVLSPDGRLLSDCRKD